MAVTAADAFLAELLSDGVSKEILLFRTGTIHNFNGIDILENFQRISARSRVVCINRQGLVNELKTRVEFVAIRMIGDEKTADIADDSAQLFHLINAADILIETESSDMTPVGRHLDAAEESDSALPSVVFDLRVSPGVIVLGNAHPMQADLLRLVNQGKGVEVAVCAAARGVGMEINKHNACLFFSLRCKRVEASLYSLLL